jgi:hypothetical protein
VKVVDSRARRVLAETRGFVRREVGALLFNAGLAGLLAWCAVHGVAEQFGLPVAAVWLLAGVAVGDAWAAARAVLQGWRELRWLRRSPAYVAAVAETDAAYERAQHRFDEARRGGQR